MSVGISNDGTEAVQRKLHVKPASAITQQGLQEKYELERTSSWITQHGYKQVALQFPDELLIHSIHISRALEKLTEANVFILGDTSYGSCCVDEVAASHYSADSIVHYGKACLSPTSRLPLLYVFGKLPLDVSDCATKFSKLITNHEEYLILLCDLVYSYYLDEVFNKLQETYPNLVLSKVTCQNKCQENVTEKNSIVQFGRTFSLHESKTLEDYTVLYIGAESFTLSNFMMTYNKCHFYSYDPEIRSGRQEMINVNRMLMKRYYMVERARDARIVGIVVGTLGVTDYLAMISQLKTLIKQAGKKSYTFVVGKLNPAKLANFMEIDVFVLVACPENTLLDSTDFYKPIVTPYEMEIACNSSRDWSSEYVTDFRELLPGASSFTEIKQLKEQQTDVSLVTGKVRTLGVSNNMIDQEPSNVVVKRDDDRMTIAKQTNTAGQFLSGRTWQGLEQQLGQTSVSKAVEGRKGIAIGYQNEPKQ